MLKTWRKCAGLIHEEDRNLLVYGCNAHLLNLLGQDITPSSVMKHVVEVQKYFRNHHQPSAWLCECDGSLKPQLPGDTRWNSQQTCIETFLRNREFMIRITQEHSDSIDSSIAWKVNNFNLYQQVKDLHIQMKPISVTLDRIQGDSANAADACDAWITLLQHPDLTMHSKVIESRMNQALQPFHLAAYLLNPKYRGVHLSEQQTESARNWIKQRDVSYISPVISFEAQAAPYPSSFWSASATSMDSCIWWRAMTKVNFPPGFVDLMIRLQKLPASSASVERVFSNFSTNQTKLRNRLGIEKAGKLVFCYRMLRGSVEFEY